MVTSPLVGPDVPVGAATGVTKGWVVGVRDGFADGDRDGRTDGREDGLHTKDRRREYIPFLEPGEPQVQRVIDNWRRSFRNSLSA